MSDIDIARNAQYKNIEDIAKLAGIEDDHVLPYGKYMAKVNASAVSSEKEGNLILVTAINPTPAGEGKTTVSVGLSDGLSHIGKKVSLTLREPSLGPVFGVKGGAAGGGYAQVVPMEDINLHFTGDIHAVSSANNLIAAAVDNHIFQGNELNIDPRRITWRRCMDMNDRQLRDIVSGMGGPANGFVRQDGFEITAASEIMAILCLSKDLNDFKKRVSNIVIGYTYDKSPVRVADLRIQGAVAALFKNAIMPNLVQTLHSVPAFIHGGPFANIAHGCNSVAATKLALKLSDYVVTEAGFGADLGAEKFFDIKCRIAGLKPKAAVIVATLRALKCHGGIPVEEAGMENMHALELGMSNLYKHIENITEVFSMPVVVAINRFEGDKEKEVQKVVELCKRTGVTAVSCTVWKDGGAGAVALATEVVKLCEKDAQLTFAYDLQCCYEDKINAIAQRIYGADGITFSPGVQNELKRLDDVFPNMPVCIAKTQYSFTDNAAKKGRPSGFKINIRSVKLSAGAGFVVAVAGSIISMPGLPKRPAALNMDIDNNGNIEGLF